MLFRNPFEPLANDLDALLARVKESCPPGGARRQSSDIPTIVIHAGPVFRQLSTPSTFPYAPGVTVRSHQGGTPGAMSSRLQSSELYDATGAGVDRLSPVQQMVQHIIELGLQAIRTTVDVVWSMLAQLVFRSFRKSM